MGRGGTPGTVVLGNGGKWPGTGTGTEGAPYNVRVQGAARRAGGPDSSPPGGHPAGSSSAPAARLSPPLEPAAPPGGSSEAAGCRRRALWPAGSRTLACEGLEELVVVETDSARMVSFHSLVRSSDGGLAPRGF